MSEPDPAAGPPAPGGDAPGDTVHLLDATMFWNPTGGVRRYVVAKHRWAQQHTGWRHTIATPMPDGLSTLRLPSMPLPGSGGAYRLPWHRAALAGVLRDARPDLIEAGDPYRLAWAALDAAADLKVPAVAFCHSNLEQMATLAVGGNRVGGGAASAARRCAVHYAVNLYRRFDLVLAPSRAMAAHLSGWGLRNVAHQPLGVDTTIFHPGRRSLRWRHSLALPADARLLVYAGRFAPEKNLPVLAAAVRRLGPRYWLLAVGAGPAQPAGERVIVLPPMLDPISLATVLASCDLFVHAGTQETFGLSALEALACGIPLVARAAEGLAELVDSSVGCGVARLAADDFAEAIAGAFDRDRDALGRAARLRAEASDWSCVMPILWQHYRGVLASMRGGRPLPAEQVGARIGTNVDLADRINAAG